MTPRALLDALAELETDMHLHVHKENNILFPRAVAAEDADAVAEEPSSVCLAGRRSPLVVCHASPDRLEYCGQPTNRG